MAHAPIPHGPTLAELPTRQTGGAHTSAEAHAYTNAKTDSDAASKVCAYSSPQANAHAHANTSVQTDNLCQQ